jgi:predicted NBD/HSP70 family sugar kinase
MEGGHMPVPLHHLGEGLDKVEPFTCGCGRTWGCIEAYSSISGLPQYIDYFLPQFPDHAFHSSTESMKANAFSLRALAQEGDELALKIFDTQAKALGIHVANMSMALDPGIVVIGGGLIDPDATTEEFRNRYIKGIEEAARPLLYPMQREKIRFCAATLGELSQAVGAALMALYSEQMQ